MSICVPYNKEICRKAPKVDTVGTYVCTSSWKVDDVSIYVDEIDNKNYKIILDYL